MPVEYNTFDIIYKGIYNIQKFFPAPVSTDYVRVVCVIILKYVSICSLHICSDIFCYKYDCSLWTWIFDIESTGSQSIEYYIRSLINYYFIGMLYNVIKYFPISNNISSMNLESRFYLLSTVFSFIGLNNIEYITVDICYDIISSFTITLSNIIIASIM